MSPLTQSKRGISSIELGRRLRVTPMMECDATKRSIGHVELDDACVGGARSGGERGRGVPARRRMSVAVETTPEGKAVCLKLRRARSFCNSIANFTKRSLDPAREVVTDGLVAGAGCPCQIVKTGSGATLAHNPRLQIGALGVSRPTERSCSQRCCCV